MTAVGRSRSRWLSPLTLALISIAAVPAGGSGSSAPGWVPQQDSTGAIPARAGNTVPADAAVRTLRHAVNGRFLIGTAVMSRRLDDPKLAALVARQFDCLTAENEFKPRSLQPQPGKFKFAAADKIVEFAQRHGMKVVGHTLCWHEPVARLDVPGPGRQATAARRGAAEPQEPHRRRSWDISRGRWSAGTWSTRRSAKRSMQYLRDTPARRAIGDDYIVKAFEFAHAADPDAELYYNDYGNEEPEKCEQDDPPGPRAQGQGRAPRRGRDPVPPAAG